VSEAIQFGTLVDGVTECSRKVSQRVVTSSAQSGLTLRSKAGAKMRCPTSAVTPETMSSTVVTGALLPKPGRSLGRLHGERVAVSLAEAAASELAVFESIIGSCDEKRT
jgi:hypothetical protein